MSDCKIAVVGVGGVGGYLAGMLCKTFENVTVVARGERKASIEEKGIVLHSDCNGEIVSRPGKVVSNCLELDEQDFIFVCVKNYSLKEICEELKSVVTDHTIVIPVMNGADVGERVREYLGRGIVVDSLIYIVAFANKDYSITQQGDFANLRIGQIVDPQPDSVKAVSDLLSEASITHKISEDIECDIWKKYMLNCAYNVLTAYYDQTIGELRADETKAKEYESLVYEAYAVAAKKGVHMDRKYADKTIDQFYHKLADNATSSLQRDYRDHKMTELETFSGYIVREAQKQGVEVPVSARMYEGLKKREV